MDDNQSITEYPTHEEHLRKLLKDERPAIIEAMIDALRAEMNARSDHPVSGVMVAARQIRDIRLALLESENRQTSLFEMIEDQVRAACRQEIEEDVSAEILDATDVRRIVRDMASDGELASQGDPTEQVREIIGEMIGNGELGVTVDVDAYLST